MPFDNSNRQGEPVTPRWQNGVRATREVASGSFSRPRGSGRLVVRDPGWEVTDSHTRLTLSLAPGHHEPRQTLSPGRPARAEASSPGVVGVGLEPGRAPTESAAPRTLAALLLLLSHFSRVRLCDPIDGSPSGSPVPGILQAKTLEWVVISFSST